MREFKAIKGKVNWIWCNKLKNNSSSRKALWIWKWKRKNQINNWIEVVVVRITQQIRLIWWMKRTIILPWNHNENNKHKQNRNKILMNMMSRTSRRNIKIKMRILMLNNQKNYLKKHCLLLHLKQCKKTNKSKMSIQKSKKNINQ